MVSAEEAINDAAFNFENLIKTELELYGDPELWLRNLSNRMLNYSAGDGTQNSILFYTKMISDIACGHISIKYGFRP
jgi:3-oxoacyl-[acyl-carrier-protein] synthase II